MPASPKEKIDEEKPVKEVPQPEVLLADQKPLPEQEESNIIPVEILPEKTPKEILLEADYQELPKEELADLIPPRFTKTIDTLSVADGDMARFTAVVFAKPMPEVKWYVDGSEIKDEPEYEVTSTDDGVCTLTLPEVIPEDEGEYMCKAVNTRGEDTCTAMLFVEGKLDCIVYNNSIVTLTIIC